MKKRQAVEKLLINMMDDGVTGKDVEKFEVMDALYFVLDAIGMRGVNNELAHMLNNILKQKERETLEVVRDEMFVVPDNIPSTPGYAHMINNDGLKAINESIRLTVNNINNKIKELG